MIPIVIKECPFCGSEATIIKQQHGYADTAYCVQCTQCRCKSAPIIIGVYMQYHGKENVTVTDADAIHDSITRWNKRTPAAVCRAN